MRIERDAATSEPVGFGIGADEQEHMANRPLFFDARAIVAPGHCGEAVRQLAMQLHQLRVRMQLDVPRRFDAINEVARHAGRETLAAHQNVDL